MTWIEIETSTYQDHVIKHVLGATILGWLIAEDAVHFVLDVGLLWTVYINGEMNLMALSGAIQDLESDELPQSVIDEVSADAQDLITNGREATGLKHLKAATVDCLITEVQLMGYGAELRTVIRGEISTIAVEASIGEKLIRVSEVNELSA